MVDWWCGWVETASEERGEGEGSLVGGMEEMYMKRTETDWRNVGGGTEPEYRAQRARSSSLGPYDERCELPALPTSSATEAGLQGDQVAWEREGLGDEATEAAGSGLIWLGGELGTWQRTSLQHNRFGSSRCIKNQSAALLRGELIVIFSVILSLVYLLFFFFFLSLPVNALSWAEAITLTVL